MTTSESVVTRMPASEMPDGLHFGLPNFWYRILESGQLGRRPSSVQRFGEKLAVWRDSTGRRSVFENHCPHRRAPLSLGKIQGEELVCSYHGWAFNRSGDCIRKPLEP